MLLCTARGPSIAVEVCWWRVAQEAKNVEPWESEQSSDELSLRWRHAELRVLLLFFHGERDSSHIDGVMMVKPSMLTPLVMLANSGEMSQFSEISGGIFEELMCDELIKPIN